MNNNVNNPNRNPNFNRNQNLNPSSNPSSNRNANVKKGSNLNSNQNSNLNRTKRPNETAKNIGENKNIQFKTKAKKEFPIIRDYFISNNHLQGIYFVMKEPNKKQIFTRFLEKENISNKFIWRRLGNFFKPSFQSIGVEMGDENKLVIERGELMITKKSLFGGKKIKQYKAERYTFILKPNDFD